jgi:hypothetical protein
MRSPAVDDNLSNSSENDVFVLARPTGNDTIHSFDFSHDKVDLIGFSGPSRFVDIQTRLSENSNGDAVIPIAEGGSITFAGVSAASLTADNLVFNHDTVMNNATSIVIGDNAVLPLAGPASARRSWRAATSRRMAAGAAPLPPPGTEHIGSSAFELRFPRCDLIGMTSNCSASSPAFDRP